MVVAIPGGAVAMTGRVVALAGIVVAIRRKAKQLQIVRAQLLSGILCRPTRRAG